MCRDKHFVWPEYIVRDKVRLGVATDAIGRLCSRMFTASTAHVIARHTMKFLACQISGHGLKQYVNCLYAQLMAK